MKKLSFLKSKKFWIIVVILLILLPWLLSLLKCETLTLLHGNEFKTGRLEEIDYIKVLSYSDKEAEIYYINSDENTGNILNFEKQNDEWIYKYGDNVWSAHGSTDGAIWPYWWHFVYSM